jgi:hypothetical protein
MAADHGIGQAHVLDLGLQLAPVMLGDLATEDDRDLVRLADGSIGVKQTFAEMSSAARRRKMRLSQYSTCERRTAGAGSAHVLAPLR